MRLVALRRVLPIVQLALFMALQLVGNEQQRAHEGELGAADPNYLSSAHELCDAINLPALFFFPAQHYVAYGLGVVALWFLVGDWLDHRLGLASAPQQRPPRIIRGIAAVVTFVLAANVGILAYQLSKAGFFYFPLVGISLIAWVLFGATVLALEIRRWR